MKKRNEETSKKMLFVVVGLSIGVPALARMIWKIWFLLAIFLDRRKCFEWTKYNVGQNGGFGFYCQS